MASNKPAYGQVNVEMVTRWFQMTPDQDGPFWALNLMKYREVAAYADGRASVSGKAADDAYSPLGPLAAIGAMVAFHGDVLDQRGGEPAWDRIGIVRYPSRAAFFAMQQRDDFKGLHEHKEAGMEFTIVMSCLPTGSDSVPVGSDDRLVLIVERGATPPAVPADAAVVATFDVEGVIVGDDRTFDRATFLRVGDDAALELVVGSYSSADDAHIMVVERSIDALVQSIESAPEPGSPS